jgi:hypothetical protein
MGQLFLVGVMLIFVILIFVILGAQFRSYL